MIEHIQLYLTRIDLDRHLRIGQEIKVFAQQRHQPADLRFIQVGRRTAAPVHLADLTAGEQRRTAGDLLRQNVQIFVGLVRLARHQLVAAAGSTAYGRKGYARTATAAAQGAAAR